MTTEENKTKRKPPKENFQKNSPFKGFPII
jgi:hypothetical protein